MTSNLHCLGREIKDACQGIWLMSYHEDTSNFHFTTVLQQVQTPGNWVRKYSGQHYTLSGWLYSYIPQSKYLDFVFRKKKTAEKTLKIKSKYSRKYPKLKFWHYRNKKLNDLRSIKAWFKRRMYKFYSVFIYEIHDLLVNSDKTQNAATVILNHAKLPVVSNKSHLRL